MNGNNSFFQKNQSATKFALGILFAIAFMLNTYHRSLYQAELAFRLNFYELTLLLSSVLIFVNPKGIKILVLLVFAYASSVATKDIFESARSGLPRGLFFRDFCGDLNFDSSIVYISHMVLYIGACVCMFVNTKVNTKELLDKE